MPLLFRLRQALTGLGLRVALPMLVKRQALPDLLASLDRPGQPGVPGGDATHRLAERLFRPLRLWPTTCLYRALGSYALLRAAGQEVRFVIGVARDGEELKAHAWLERDGRAIVSTPGPGPDYTVAYAWPVDPGRPPRDEGARPGAGITPSPDVHLTRLPDGSGVLLHLGTGHYFTLNASGVRAWTFLDAGLADADALTAALAADYPGIEVGRIRADVLSLLSEFEREALIFKGK